jgi:Tfp pilus assembly protein PilN
MDLKLTYWWEKLVSSLMAGDDSLGVYLDEGGLTLAHMQRGLQGIQVQHLTRLPKETGKVEDLALVLQETVAAWGLESCPASLAVARNLGFIRRATLPRAARENLSQVVLYELDRFLPLPGEKLYYDFQVLAETDTEVHLLLLALPRGTIEGYLNLLTAATLRPMSLELAPVAVANVFATQAGKLPSSWLLLHLEPGAFELTHIQGQAIKDFHQERHIPAKDFPKQVMAQLDSLHEGGRLPRSLCLYGSGGAGFDVRALTPYDLDIMYPSHFTLKGLPPETDQTGAVPAVGAALRSLGKVPLGFNLIPPSERAAGSIGGFSFTRVALLVFLGLCLLWAGSAFLHTRVLLYQVNRQIAALSPEARQVEQQLEESRALAQQMESLRKIGQTPDKLKVLKDLTQLIPENTWLFNLRLSKQNLDISGMSQSASDLIPRLEKSGWLKKTEFASPIVTDASKFEHFKIKAEIKGLEPGT